MASVWNAAEALLAMAGGQEAALAAARDLATECARSGDFNEATFWRAVADAVVFETNPQPLIAPDLGPSLSTRTRPQSRQRKMELPDHRSNVLKFRRHLRELWERYGRRDDRSDGSTKGDKPD